MDPSSQSPPVSPMPSTSQNSAELETTQRLELERFEQLHRRFIEDLDCAHRTQREQLIKCHRGKRQAKNKESQISQETLHRIYYENLMAGQQQLHRTAEKIIDANSAASKAIWRTIDEVHRLTHHKLPEQAHMKKAVSPPTSGNTLPPSTEPTSDKVKPALPQQKNRGRDTPTKSINKNTDLHRSPTRSTQAVHGATVIDGSNTTRSKNTPPGTTGEKSVTDGPILPATVNSGSNTTRSKNTPPGITGAKGVTDGPILPATEKNAEDNRDPPPQILMWCWTNAARFGITATDTMQSLRDRKQSALKAFIHDIEQVFPILTTTKGPWTAESLLKHVLVQAKKQLTEANVPMRKKRSASYVLKSPEHKRQKRDRSTAGTRTKTPSTGGGSNTSTEVECQNTVGVNIPAVPTGAAHTGAAHTGAVNTNTGAVNTGAIPASAVSTGPIPTSAIPTGAISTNAVPTSAGSTGYDYAAGFSDDDKDEQYSPNDNSNAYRNTLQSSNDDSMSEGEDNSPLAKKSVHPPQASPMIYHDTQKKSYWKPAKLIFAAPKMKASSGTDFNTNPVTTSDDINIDENGVGDEMKNGKENTTPYRSYHGRSATPEENLAPEVPRMLSIEKLLMRNPGGSKDSTGVSGGYRGSTGERLSNIDRPYVNPGDGQRARNHSGTGWLDPSSIPYTNKMPEGNASKSNTQLPHITSKQPHFENMVPSGSCGSDDMITQQETTIPSRHIVSENSELCANPTAVQPTGSLHESQSAADHAAWTAEIARINKIINDQRSVTLNELRTKNQSLPEQNTSLPGDSMSPFTMPPSTNKQPVRSIFDNLPKRTDTPTFFAPENYLDDKENIDGSLDKIATPTVPKVSQQYKPNNRYTAEDDEGSVTSVATEYKVQDIYRTRTKVDSAGYIPASPSESNQEFENHNCTLPPPSTQVIGNGEDRDRSSGSEKIKIKKEDSTSAGEMESISDHEPTRKTFKAINTCWESDSDAPPQLPPSYVSLEVESPASGKTQIPRHNPKSVRGGSDTRRHSKAAYRNVHSSSPAASPPSFWTSATGKAVTQNIKIASLKERRRIKLSPHDSEDDEKAAEEQQQPSSSERGGWTAYTAYPPV